MKVSERKAVSIKMGMIEWLWKGGRVCMDSMHVGQYMSVEGFAWMPEGWVWRRAVGTR